MTTGSTNRADCPCTGNDGIAPGSIPDFKRIAELTHGEMKADEYRDLYEVALAVQPGIVVEVGPARGGATVALGLAAQRNAGIEGIVAIDVFRKSRALLHYDDVDANIEELKRNLAAFGCGEKVEVMVAGSEDWDLIRSNGISLLVIDADGTLDRDFSHFYNLLLPGASVFIDDCELAINRHCKTHYMRERRGFSADPVVDADVFLEKVSPLGKEYITACFISYLVGEGLLVEVGRSGKTITLLKPVDARAFSESDEVRMQQIRAQMRERLLAVRAETLAIVRDLDPLLRQVRDATGCGDIIVYRGADAGGKTRYYTFDWAAYDARDAAWWHSTEARSIADDIVVYQQPDGGWRKNMTLEEEHDWNRSSIDNNATWGQIRFLAKSYTATGDERYRDACLRGIDYLMDVQYDNGGWPQVAGMDGAYEAHITFNDNAMVGVMRVLGAVAARSADEGFAWIDDGYAARASAAFDKGLECILRCQVEVDGTLAVWCQQHDERTLAPVSGRAYEPASLCAEESAGIVEFLQDLDSDDPAVERSVEAALAWFESVELHGVRFEQVGDDMQLVEGSSDDVLWARMYDLERGVPIFGDRDGRVYRDVADISKERRLGYDWYGTWPEKCLRRAG